MSISERDYYKARSEYEKTLNSVNSILSKKDTPDTIEERVQRCRDIITQLSTNRSVLEKCQNTITMYKKNNNDMFLIIDATLNYTFINNLEDIDIRHREISHLIEKDEDILADSIQQELSSDYPDLKDLKRLTDLLMANRPQFASENDKISKLFNAVSNDHGIEALDNVINNYVTNFDIIADRPVPKTASDDLDNKIALISVLIQEKVLESAKQLSNFYHQNDGIITLEECSLLKEFEKSQLLPKKLNISDLITPMLKDLSEDKRVDAIKRLSTLPGKTLRYKIFSLPPELMIPVLTIPEFEKNVESVIKLHKNQVASEIILKMITNNLFTDHPNPDVGLDAVIKLRENQFPSEIILKMIEFFRLTAANVNAVIKLNENQFPFKIISEAIPLFCRLAYDISTPLEIFFGLESKKTKEAWLTPKKWAKILPKLEKHLKKFPESQSTWEYLLNLQFDPKIDPITIQITESIHEKLPKSLLMTQSETLKTLFGDIPSSDASEMTLPIAGNASDQAKQKFFLCLKEGLKGKSQDHLSSKENQIELYHLADYYEVIWMQNILRKKLLNNFDVLDIYKAMNFSDFTSADLEQVKLSPHSLLYMKCIWKIASNPETFSNPQHFAKMIELMEKKNDVNLFKQICSFVHEIKEKSVAIDAINALLKVNLNPTNVSEHYRLKEYRKRLQKIT